MNYQVMANRWIQDQRAQGQEPTRLPNRAALRDVSAAPGDPTDSVVLCDGECVVLCDGESSAKLDPSALDA